MQTNTPKLNMQQWIDADNGTCPACGGESVNEDSVVREWQQCFTYNACLECGATWVAVFGLSNCTELVVDGQNLEVEDSPTETKEK